MKGKRKFIVPSLLIINMLMLVTTLIPHHHHLEGSICIKRDIATEQQCPVHHVPHHHPENDACCDGNCVTRVQSPSPSPQTYHGPEHVLVTTLFTDRIIEFLSHPLARRFRNYYTYLESLHSVALSHALSLRAPPSLVLA